MISEKQAMEILKKYKTPKEIIEHSIAVSKKAVHIAEKLRQKGYNVNIEVVKIAGLLHDIGKLKAKGITHGAETGKILREVGCCEAIARTAELHNYPDTNLSDLHLEAKIIVYADAITMHDKYVTLKKRFDDVIQRRIQAGRIREADMIKSYYPQLKKIEKEILDLMKD